MISQNKLICKLSHRREGSTMTCGCTVVVLYSTVLYCRYVLPVRWRHHTTSCSHPGRRNNLICADTRCAALGWAALGWTGGSPDEGCHYYYHPLLTLFYDFTPAYFVPRSKTYITIQIGVNQPDCFNKPQTLQTCQLLCSPHSFLFCLGVMYCELSVTKWVCCGIKMKCWFVYQDGASSCVGHVACCRHSLDTGHSHCHGLVTWWESVVCYLLMFIFVR